MACDGHATFPAEVGGGAASWGGTGDVASVRTATWQGGGVSPRDVLVLPRGTGKCEGDGGRGLELRDDEGRGVRGWDGEDGKGTAVSTQRIVGVALVHQNLLTQSADPAG